MTISHDPYHAYLPYPSAEVPHAAKGPLSGLSVGVKDIFDVAGYPSGWGQPHALALSGIKTKTAPFVQMFLDAGAHINGCCISRKRFSSACRSCSYRRSWFGW